MIDNESSSLTTGWYVYVLQCKDGTFYTGITTDPERRLKEHNTGKGSKYTRSRIPCFLMKSWEVANRSVASKLELKIKSLTKKEKTSVCDLDCIDHLL
jgi:putative endonuclease